ncbi:hypothetical protein LINPERHAP2_LOCUS35238 [Linum perenne]
MWLAWYPTWTRPSFTWATSPIGLPLKDVHL